MNILHMLVALGSEGPLKLLKHVLEHLPKEIIERLLRQQTKKSLYTVGLQWTTYEYDAYPCI